MKTRGFSLLEMVVYIAILIFMLGIITEVVLSVTRSERVIQAVRRIENSAVIAVERIGREVRAAESVNVEASTLGVHPGRLVLTYATSTTEFYLTNGRLMLRENGVDQDFLTEEQAQVTDLKFHRFYATSTEGIRVEMTIESGTSTHYRVEKFYSSSSIR
jgi:type II secretory pathway pseudopilin PulG